MGWEQPKALFNIRDGNGWILRTKEASKKTKIWSHATQERSSLLNPNLFANYLAPWFRALLAQSVKRQVGYLTEVDIMLDIETERIYVIYGKSRSNALCRVDRIKALWLLWKCKLYKAFLAEFAFPAVVFPFRLHAAWLRSFTYAIYCRAIKDKTSSTGEEFAPKNYCFIWGKIFDLSDWLKFVCPNRMTNKRRDTECGTGPTLIRSALKMAPHVKILAAWLACRRRAAVICRSGFKSGQFPGMFYHE